MRGNFFVVVVVVTMIEMMTKTKTTMDGKAVSAGLFGVQEVGDAFGTGILVLPPLYAEQHVLIQRNVIVYGIAY